MVARMLQKRAAAAAALLAALFAALYSAQDLGAQAFGFGDAGFGAAAGEEADSSAGASGAGGGASGARVRGSIEVAASAFLADFDRPADAALSNGSVGRLEFTASGSRAEAAFKLKVSEAILSADPSKLIDEAYVRLFLGPAAVEAGLLKAVWGKADSQSVLDVLNPLDLSDLSITDSLERKIAQPMLRASFALGSASKLEAAFIPSFTPNAVAWEGRWMPARIGEYIQLLGAGNPDAAAAKISFPETSTLKYAQGGARFTTTFGSVDLGAQYFYGFLPTFAVSPKDVHTHLNYGSPAMIPVSYNRYHQAGVDAAAELFGLNWRAEAALNLTDDLAGDDPDAYNPSVAWNLGFDRELFAGISLNLQGSGSVRLFDGKVASNGALDLENGSGAAKTKITAYLSQKLFKETVEWKVAGLYGVEDKDFFLFPSVAYIAGDARVELAVGLFGGDKKGELGQFADSSYVKLSLRYSF